MTTPLPAWSTARDDPRPDDGFYAFPRLVTHIDDAAIRAVGDLYAELGVDGSGPQPRRVLDLMSSWVSHLHTPPTELVVLGRGVAELDANPVATAPRSSATGASTRAYRCRTTTSTPRSAACRSTTSPARSRYSPTSPGCCVPERPSSSRSPTGSSATADIDNSPTKAVHGWLATDDAGRVDIVVEYLRLAGGFDPAEVSLRTPSDRAYRGDPLWAVVARAR